MLSGNGMSLQPGYGGYRAAWGYQLPCIKSQRVKLCCAPVNHNLKISTEAAVSRNHQAHGGLQSLLPDMILAFLDVSECGHAVYPPAPV